MKSNDCKFNHAPNERQIPLRQLRLLSSWFRLTGKHCSYSEQACSRRRKLDQQTTGGHQPSNGLPPLDQGIRDRPESESVEAKCSRTFSVNQAAAQAPS